MFLTSTFITHRCCDDINVAKSFTTRYTILSASQLIHTFFALILQTLLFIILQELLVGLNKVIITYVSDN